MATVKRDVIDEKMRGDANLMLAERSEITDQLQKIFLNSEEILIIGSRSETRLSSRLFRNRAGCATKFFSKIKCRELLQNYLGSHTRKVS